MPVSTERKELWRELDQGFQRLRELTLDLSVAGVMLTGRGIGDRTPLKRETR